MKTIQYRISKVYFINRNGLHEIRKNTTYKDVMKLKKLYMDLNMKDALNILDHRIKAYLRIS